MSTDFLTTTEDERQSVMEARAYVTSRFFPPLPVEYGDIAVIALREYREHGPEAHVNLPDHLNPKPRLTYRDEDGDLYSEAAHLIEILRIEHMTWDDEPEVENPCRECGEETGNDDPNTDWGMCGDCLHNAMRSGWTPGEEE